MPNYSAGLLLLKDDNNFKLWDEKLLNPVTLTYTFLSSLTDYYSDSSDQIDIDNHFDESTSKGVGLN